MFSIDFISCATVLINAVSRYPTVVKGFLKWNSVYDTIDSRQNYTKYTKM